MKEITEDVKKIPVLAETDVVVVGGGPAGIGAALAAARNGAKTILIEQSNCLGGMQTQCLNPNFSIVDSAIQGGIISDIIQRLTKEGAVISDESAHSRQPMTWGTVFFDPEYYKLLLDNMMEEAGVKLLYHAFAVAAVKEGTTVKGVILESKEGRQAVLGKVVVDATGSADIAWKSGTPCMPVGFESGPNKGRHMGYGYSVYFRDVDFDRLQTFAKERPTEWFTMGGDVITGGVDIIKKAVADGDFSKLDVFTFHPIGEPGAGRIAVHTQRHYTIPPGHHSWETEQLTAGETALRKGAWAGYKVLKQSVPGFEDSHIEQTPTHLLLRDTHRILGEYVLTEQDVLQGSAFDDSVVMSNMAPEVWGPDMEYELVWGSPYDIPYRCLVPKETENLLAAGGGISSDFKTYAGLRYCTPSICTGQAAGTAAALSVKNKVTPRNLDVKLVQDTLRKQKIPFSVKHLSKDILEAYQERVMKSMPIKGTMAAFIEGMLKQRA